MLCLRKNSEMMATPTTLPGDVSSLLLSTPIPLDRNQAMLSPPSSSGRQGDALHGLPPDFPGERIAKVVGEGAAISTQRGKSGAFSSYTASNISSTEAYNLNESPTPSDVSDTHPRLPALRARL